MKRMVVRIATVIAMSLSLVSVPASSAARQAAPAAPPAPSTTVGDIWAWVVVRAPGSTIDYMPDTGDHAASNGGDVLFHRVSKGTYQLTFFNLELGTHENNGNAFVTPLDPRPKMCAVTDIISDGTDLHVNVSCYKLATPHASDSAFSLNFIQFSGDTGHAGYTWNSDPTIEFGEYAPDAQYQYSTDTSFVSITRRKTGIWNVRMPYLGSNRGTVIVGNSSALSTCRAVKWFTKHADRDEIVRIACNQIDGPPVDNPSYTAWMRGMGLKGPGGTNVAFVYADQPSASSYTPQKAFRYSSSGSIPHVTRGGVGLYTVAIDGMPFGGSAQITAVSSAVRHCNLTSIAFTDPSQRLGVRCFDKNGDRADSAFTLSYAN